MLESVSGVQILEDFRAFRSHRFS